MPYYVYVRALDEAFAMTRKERERNPDFKPGGSKRCYYVGYSSKTPKERYQQHIDGARNANGPLYSRIVHKYGIHPNGLRPRQYKRYNPIHTKEEAMALEEEIALRLQRKGHCVWWN